MSDNIDIYKYWIRCLPDIGDVTIYRLLSEYIDEAQIYDACKRKDKLFEEIIRSVRGQKFDCTHIYEYTEKYDPEINFRKLQDANIEFITRDNTRYPRRLKALNPMPYAIFAKGRIPEDDIPSIAIIGARNCSEYGTFISNAFGNALGSEGINIISGMATGVDGIAQRGALEAGGDTFAVLANGVDICYPEANKQLYNLIVQKGGVLSVYPPGTQPIKRQFPERNKIVAALSDMLLVVEARQKSGTSITVELALKMGKDVYAVPGRITDRLSDGCNTLIRQGAGIALSPEDIVRELSLIWQKDNPNSKKLKPNLINKMDLWRKPKEEGILKYLDIYPQSADDIHQKRLVDEPNATLMQTLSELVLACVDQKACQVGTGFFYKCL